MNKKNIVKVILDFIMTILMVLMFNKRVISMSFHEKGGIVLCVLILFHLILNYRWIIAVTKKLFDKRVKVKTKIGYIVNVFLFISIFFIGISGVLISKTIFRNVSSSNMIFKIGHQAVAGFSLIFIGVHIGLNWLWIKGMFKRLIKVPLKMQKGLSIVCLILLVGTGVYSMYSTSFIKWISMPFSISGMQMQKNQMNEHNHPNNINMEKPKGNQNQGKEQRMNGYGGKAEGQGIPNIQQKTSIVGILKVIINYLSIIGCFAVFTTGTEWLLSKRVKCK